MNDGFGSEEKRCFSCLGGSTEDLSTESLMRDGCVRTKGCFNYVQASDSGKTAPGGKD